MGSAGPRGGLSTKIHHAVDGRGRPPAFDAMADRDRNVVERSFAHLNQWRRLATRYEELAITYRAAAAIHE